MPSGNGNRTVAITSAQERFASWMADVLIYTVVLNLFVEYVDEVIIESFTVSVLTAVLLKLLLDLVLGFEHHVRDFFEQREGTIYRVAGTVSMFAILFLGKFFILEVVDLVFGDSVELGHFIEIVALILAMMATREVFRRLYVALGESDGE